MSSQLKAEVDRLRAEVAELKAEKAELRELLRAQTMLVAELARPKPSKDAERAKRYRDNKRDAVTVASRDESRSECVTRHVTDSPPPVPPSLPPTPPTSPPFIPPPSEKPMSAGADVGEGTSPPGPIEAAVEQAAQLVFEHWRKASGRSERTAFDSRRRTRVVARLREGSTAVELCEAVDGCLLTPHNRGENETGQKYDDLELICRSAAHVERFRRNAQSPPKTPRPEHRGPGASWKTDWSGPPQLDATGQQEI